MGNFLSNTEENIKEAETIEKLGEEVEKIKEEAKHLEEIVEPVVEDVIKTVVEEILVTEIEKKLTTKNPKLEKITEDKPYNPSPTHYSNLKIKMPEQQLEIKPLQQPPKSDLTRFPRRSYFSFYH